MPVHPHRTSRTSNMFRTEATRSNRKVPGAGSPLLVRCRSRSAVHGQLQCFPTRTSLLHQHCQGSLESGERICRFERSCAAWPDESTAPHQHIRPGYRRNSPGKRKNAGEKRSSFCSHLPAPMSTYQIWRSPRSSGGRRHIPLHQRHHAGRNPPSTRRRLRWVMAAGEGGHCWLCGW